jgi:hypothetical protein
MPRISSAIPVAPSILHTRQTKILLAIQEIKRQGRKAVSLKNYRHIENDYSSAINTSYSTNDIDIINDKQINE